MVWCGQVSEGQFAEYLNGRLPISQEMSIIVEEFSSCKVRLGVKFNPYANQLPTAFGGSINNIMTICGWALVYNIIQNVDPEANLQIQKSSIEYIKPIETDFVAECEMINKEKKDRFIKTYQRLGKARLEIKVQIRDTAHEVLARFRGLYILFQKEQPVTF